MASRPIATHIRGLRVAYAQGLDPTQVVESVFDAIGAAGVPGIFISIADPKAARKAKQRLGRFDPTRPLWGIP